MWLASISLTRRDGRKLCTPSWDPAIWSRAYRLLDELTKGIGHPDHYRFFRMQITACKHVPLRQDEIDILPPTWHETQGVCMAGGPVEALDSFGLPKGLISAQSCEKPGHRMLDESSGDPDLWLPIDCGTCPSCMARLELAGTLR